MLTWRSCSEQQILMGATASSPFCQQLARSASTYLITQLLTLDVTSHRTTRFFVWCFSRRRGYLAFVLCRNGTVDIEELTAFVWSDGETASDKKPRMADIYL